MAISSKSGRHVSRSHSSLETDQTVQIIETICAGGSCHQGLVRDSNEDRCFYRTFTYTGELGQEQGLMAAVADGMGGHAAGETASERAIQVLGTQFLRIAAGEQSRQISPDWPTMLRDAFLQANTEVHNEANRWSGRSGMGTTLTAAVIAGDVMYLGHVGDSRAYLIRNGKIIRLTEDHTWVAERVKRGQMTASEAELSDRRGQLTQAIGHKDSLQPEIDAIGLRPGDRIILCTDGITEMLCDSDILSICSSGSNVNKIASKLIDTANRAGGYDNSAVVVIDCRSESFRSNLRLPKFPQRSSKWAVAALVLVLLLLLTDGIYLVSKYIGGEDEAEASTPSRSQVKPAGLTPSARENWGEGKKMIDLSGNPVEVTPE